MRKWRLDSTNVMAGLIVLAAQLAATAVSAGGLLTYEDGSASSYQAGAGRATISDGASVVASNPAALTELDGLIFTGALQGIYSETAFSAGRDDGAYSSLPGGAFYLGGASLGDLSFGVGIHSFLGAEMPYDRDWPGRFYLIDARWVTLNLSPAAAWKINDALSIGVALHLQKSEMEAGVVVNNAIYGAPEDLPDGRISFTDDSYDIGATLGVLYQANPSLRLGFVWTSETEHDHKAKLKGTGLHPVLGGLLQDLQFDQVSMNLVVPEHWLFSTTYQINDQWQVSTNVGRQFWSDFGDLRAQAGPIDQAVYANGLQDTWHFALGARYQLTQTLWLATGVGYDGDPVKETVGTVYFPSREQWRWSLGMGAEVSRQLSADVGYSYTRIGATDSYDAEPILPIPGAGTLAGHFDAVDVHIVTARVNYRF